MRLKLPLIGLACLAAFAAVPVGYEHWTNDQLQTHVKKLSGKVTADTIGSWSNHSLVVAHREQDGEAEVHERKVDIMFIEAGDADIVIGGTVPDSKSTGPGERRGTKIEGGTKQALHAGDVIHIPADTPHQMLVQAGHKIDYYTVKVVSK